MKPAYDAEVLMQRLHRSADELKTLLVQFPDRDAITDVLDYVVGAFYGLTKAIEVGFVDRPSGWHSAYRSHLPKYVDDIKTGKPPNAHWLGGFYFNSAIQRLAACFDRIPKLLRARGKNVRARMTHVNPKGCPAWANVYGEINAFKHDVAGKAAGRTVSVADAAQAFEELVTLLKANEAKVIALYR